MRNFFVFLSIFFLIIVFSSFLGPERVLAQSTPDAQNKRFDMATYKFNNLTFNQGETNRDRWLQSVQSLKMSYHRSPSHSKAPLALFTLGKMYEEMYDRFQDAHYITEAVGYYEDLADLFPKDALADDALFNLGNISLKKKKNVKKAKKVFARIIAVYPSGDMAESAAFMLRNINTKDANASSDIFTKTKKEQPSTVERPMAYLSQPIRYWSTKNYTRVVIEPSVPVQFKEAFLKADGELPRRLYIDLYNSRIAPTFQNPIPIRDGLLKQVRGAQFDKNTVRVVLDTDSVSDYKIFTMEDPFRVVIDVTGGSKPQFKEKLPTLAEQFGLGVKTIVIDPGHGGKDPGAIGLNGLQEKDIVLKVAKKVAAILQKETAFKVLLTRDRDIFIPLEERTAIANTKEADLFVSIHANSAPNNQARGVETYFLSLATSREEMNAAARENAASSSQISDLQKILQDLMQNSKIEESSRLASCVQGELVTGLNKKYPVKNLGIKKAPFIVLIGAQMPAILTEIAFLTNPEEVCRLQDDRYLESIAHYIVSGVRQYAAKLNGM